MHEFSLAVNIVDIAEKHAREQGEKKIETLELEVGSLSGVVIEALETALDEAVKNTLLANAKIILHEIQACASCKECGDKFDLHDFFEICPRCQSMDYKILQGKELQVKSIKIK